MTTTGPVGRLDGKTVLITGGARGQGAAHAERLAREGARVIACDVLQDEGAALSDRLRGEGLDVTYRGLDVTEATAWQGLISEVGRVDVLINNAGIIHLAPIQEQAREAWDATLAVNLTGAMLGIQAVLPGMRSHSGSGRGGSMINIASIFGVVGAPGYAAYCASKAGLIALTKVAALELAGDNIRVNVIVPSGVSTPMNEHEKEGGVIPDTPLGRRAPSERDLRCGGVPGFGGLELRHRVRAGGRRRIWPGDHSAAVRTGGRSSICRSQVSATVKPRGNGSVGSVPI